LLAQKIILIALAGGLGTLSRYGLSGLVQRLTGAGFPWGTLAVNLLGCFVFGLVWSAGQGRLGLSAEARTVVLVGFMGAFTTMSTFVFETGGFLKDGQWLLGLGNILAQNLVGLTALFLGFSAGRGWG